MKKIKILHCGDMHFDTPFKELNSKLSSISKEELLEVLSTIINICKINSVDIMLMAGDIFDNLTVNKKTLAFIREQLERIENIKVFISPGNHDPYNTNSFYKMIEWPSNVHVFKSEMEKVYIEKLDTIVWGAAFNKPHIRESLLNAVKAQTNYINLMVLHGEISQSEGGNVYNPITLREIGESGVDYLALGHRHSYTGILREGSTCYAYCGCPQGRGFDEVGDKGVILGEVYKGSVNLEFTKTSKRNYYVREVDISKAFSNEEVKAIILRDVKEEDRLKNFYKIVLVGTLEPHLNLKEDVIFEKLKDEFYFIKIVDKTEIQIDFDEISKDYSLKGIFAAKLLKELEENKDEENIEVIKMALKLGIQCLSQEEVNLNDY
ncbi:metallophosphoesterase family protein [Clostridium gasigenes]|uniref:DNA repair exonuclease n=1 Tax=Clostridium gasigenes TaxID=94869 RepID=A0A7X0SB11_9CLOT|nr:DNA repair exonuclease [Clostridium gasigenes]MBB6714252.1 DNA repair exonuclease [Clostridium gasigenes]